MDRLHHTNVCDHLMILSQCLFKFEVSREVGKVLWTYSFYPNFFKIKLSLVCHDTLCYLIDSLNLNDSAEEIDPFLECTFGNTQYFFSSAQDPNEESSVFKTSRKFACALVNCSAPTVFVRGGNFAKEHELPIEAALPFAFPYGIKRPKNEASNSCIYKSVYSDRYLWLVMPQFMMPDVVLVLHQMFSRQISFETGVMTCRNQISGNDFGKSLTQVTAKDFDQSAYNPDHAINSNVQHIVKSITTSGLREFILREKITR